MAKRRRYCNSNTLSVLTAAAMARIAPLLDQELDLPPGYVNLVMGSSSMIGEVLSGNTVQSLPLNGRNYLQLASLIPGATTRDGKIAPDELSGSTISLTNTGSRGAVWDTPIINQPNAAIFATPAIVKRPVVVDDPDLGEVVAVRHMMYGILTYDHRIIDGADAARFLVKVKEVLEAADFEGDLGLERE